MQKDQKSQQIPQHKDIQVKQSKDLDDFDQILNNFDDTPLNLTNEEKKEQQDQDPQMANKIKEQYQKFIKEMQGGLGDLNGEAEQDLNMDNLGNMLGNLMKGLTEEMGGQQMEGDNEFSKKFAQMFKNINEDNVQDAASQLLNQFMDKSLLLEPMQETKVNYQQFFEKHSKSQVNCSQEDLSNYHKQFQVVKKILHILENEPSNKSEMIKLFEQMQQYGTPPQGIAPQTTGMSGMMGMF